jgi:thiol-disulfide isomerase/thioredoxin
LIQLRVKVGLLLLFLVVAFSFVVSPVVGKTKAYNFTLTDIYGNPFSLSDYKGKVVLIDFFRLKPDCPACIYEIPYLKGVYNKYSRNDVIIMSLSVSSSDTDDTLKNNFVKQYDIPWIVACGAGEIASTEYGVTAIPTLFIVDNDGYYDNPHVGVTSESELISEIDSFFITLLSPENKEYTTPIVTLNFNISKAASWICYSLDGEENVTINGNINLTNLADGAHNVTVYFKEAYGNTIYSNKVYFTIDTTTQPDTEQTGPPYTLIAIIGGAVIVFLVVGIVVAGQLLGWSEPAKKRRSRKDKR